TRCWFRAATITVTSWVKMSVVRISGNRNCARADHPERQTVLSLWSLASSPLILGVNLTQLRRPDLKLPENRAVLSVEQDGIDASMITNGHTAKVIAKTERNGDVVVGLFNTTAKAEVISTKAFAIGLPSGGRYRVANLWTRRVTRSGTTISVNVRPHGVAF